MDCTDGIDIIYNKWEVSGRERACVRACVPHGLLSNILAHQFVGHESTRL